MYMYKKDDPEYISLMKGCFHCSSGELLGIAQVCDGEEDCKDGSDETSHGGETHFDGCFAIRGINRFTVYVNYLGKKNVSNHISSMFSFSS